MISDTRKGLASIFVRVEWSNKLKMELVKFNIVIKTNEHINLN